MREGICRLSHGRRAPPCPLPSARTPSVSPWISLESLGPPGTLSMGFLHGRLPPCSWFVNGGDDGICQTKGDCKKITFWAKGDVLCVV